MPPKKQQKNKDVQKRVAKAVVDKTFGMKNKNKSKKVQDFIQQVRVTAATAGMTRQQMDAMKYEKEQRKLAKEMEAAKLAEKKLFAPIITQKKLGVGVDPKTVVCEFFKAGNCVRGAACRYSHDVGVERKGKTLPYYLSLPFCMQLRLHVLILVFFFFFLP